MNHPSTETDTATPVTENIHLSKEEFDRLPGIAKDAIKVSGIPLSLSASVSDKEFSVATASVDISQNLAGIVRTLRWDWGNRKGDWILRLNWGAVAARNAVFVAIAEGVAGGPTAGKSIGGAKYTLFNVAPRPGGVDIWININWDSDLRIYVDYLVVTIDRFGP